MPAAIRNARQGGDQGFAPPVWARQLAGRVQRLAEPPMRREDRHHDGQVRCGVDVIVAIAPLRALKSQVQGGAAVHSVHGVQRSHRIGVGQVNVSVADGLPEHPAQRRRRLLDRTGWRRHALGGRRHQIDGPMVLGHYERTQPSRRGPSAVCTTSLSRCSAELSSGGPAGETEALASER